MRLCTVCENQARPERKTCSQECATAARKRSGRATATNPKRLAEMAAFRKLSMLSTLNGKVYPL